MPEVPSHFSEFDAAAAGQVLGAEPRTTRDIAHGYGEALNVGDTVLEVYRDAGFARVTTPDARIELYRVPRFSVSGERVVFEQGDDDERTRLQIRADGKVAFHPVLRATESPSTRELALSGHQDSPANGGTSEPATGSADAIPEQQEAVQQQLRGRLGRDPWFSTRDDRPAAGFPLAVNPEDGGKAIWHNVVTFDGTAEELQQAHSKGVIRKGRLVDVTGQPVLHEEPKPNGGIKKTTEFHASTVARVTSRTVPIRRSN